MIKKLFQWAFRKELDELTQAIQQVKATEQRLNNLLGVVDIAVDVHDNDRYYAHSWACISIQGQRMDFVKFVDLGDRDIMEISRFLQHFDRGNIDASPPQSKFLRFSRKY